jgi:hypothetical protein
MAQSICKTEKAVYICDMNKTKTPWLQARQKNIQDT